MRTQNSERHTSAANRGSQTQAQRATPRTLGIWSKGPSTNGSTSCLFHTGWPDSVAATLQAARVACGVKEGGQAGRVG